MEYVIVISKSDYKALRKHLLTDRSKEQMAITLCGVNKTANRTDFLVRHVILLPADAFSHQSSGRIELKPEIQRYIFTLAKDENLSQIDWHSHPGESSNVNFSGIDDYHERKLSSYLKVKIPNTFYGSVVVNSKSMKARVWINGCVPQDINIIKVGFDNVLKPSNNQTSHSDMFDRQVRAFGVALQSRLSEIKVAVVGLGGFSILTELVARLGVRDFVLIDNDVIEITNLNRVVTATLEDSKNQTPKVEVAKRNILDIYPGAKVTALQKSVFDKEVIEHLKSADIIIVATDNYSTRLFLNRLANQYLIPLIHLGVNIDVSKKGKITDISGEFVIIEPGQRWCLQCSQIINSQLDSWEMASDLERSNLLSRGYIKDVPAPAVYHLNATIASIACAEIHNFVYQYKPQRNYVTYNAIKSELMEIQIKLNKSCPICSSAGTLGLGDLEPLPDFNRHSSIPAANFNKGDKENETASRTQEKQE